jgi:hypothetical protein
MRQIRKQELGFDDFFSVLHCRNGIAAPCRQLAGLRCEFPVFGENLLARALFGRCVIPLDLELLTPFDRRPGIGRKNRNPLWDLHDLDNTLLRFGGLRIE